MKFKAMYFPVASLACFLNVFCHTVNADELPEEVENYPVSDCFCQSNSSSINMTIIIKKAALKIATTYNIYALPLTAHSQNNDKKSTYTTNNDRNYNYVRNMSDVKRLRINLDKSKNNPFKDNVCLFDFPKNASNCKKSDNLKEKRCVIILELSKIFQEKESKQPVQVHGRLGDSKTLSCNSDDRTSHSWRMQYDNEQSLRGPKLPEKEELVLFLEKFDNNMRVQCLDDGNEILTDYVISIENTNINENLSIINYNSGDEINFECPSNYTVGVVDPQNMLRSLQEGSVKKTFTKSDDGTILCCLHFLEEDNKATRNVTNKTVLIYNQELTSTSGEQAYTSETNYNTLYIAAGITTCFLLLCIIFATHWRIKKISSRPADRLLYADLVNLGGNPIRSNISNASPYATIIGSLHPKESTN